MMTFLSRDHKSFDPFECKSCSRVHIVISGNVEVNADDVSSNSSHT